MNAIFKNLKKNEELEAAEDRLGGGGSVFPTALYEGTVKAAYVSTAKSGAQAVNLVLEIDGKEYRETIYVTDRNGNNYWVDKQDPKKLHGLPGYTIIDDLCLLTTGEPLNEQNAEEKIFKIYDFDLKKEVPTAVPMLMGLLGQVATFAITQIKEFKSKKDASGSYVETADTRDVNTISKVFHGPSGLTVAEAREHAKKGETEEAPVAVFRDAWEAKFAGKVHDKTLKGPKGGASEGAPKPGQAKAKSSLFAGL